MCGDMLGYARKYTSIVDEYEVPEERGISRYAYYTMNFSLVLARRWVKYALVCWYI